MLGKWSFRFTIPQPVPPDSRPITADQAEQELLKQLETQQRPKDDVLWDLARFYSLTLQQEKALRRVQQLVNLAEGAEKKAGCYLAMGQLMEQMQNYELAITYYSQALSLEPAHNQTWYLIHNNLGYCLNHFGRHAEAVPYLQQAIQIDPLRHNAYKNMGIACEGLGQYAEAAIFYIKAVQTNASDPRALRHLETLVEKQPTVVNDVPDFPMHLAACRAAVHHAMEVRRVVIKDTVRPE